MSRFADDLEALESEALASIARKQSIDGTVAVLEGTTDQSPVVAPLAPELLEHIVQQVAPIET